jgi:acetolactate synthase-1/2/3 large subunit
VQLLRTLVESGVEACFGNPGTSEMHFVAALDRVEGMRGVLGLFEGAVTGMADGYGRMAEKPAATLLHLGPGQWLYYRPLTDRKGGVQEQLAALRAVYNFQGEAPASN